MTQVPEMEALVFLKEAVIDQMHDIIGYNKGLCPLVWNLYMNHELTTYGYHYLVDIIDERFNEISEVYVYDYDNEDENGNTAVIAIDKSKAIDENYDPYYYWHPKDWQVRLDFINEKLKQYEN